mmetsp:Transcript_12366/g.28116  ORF Transcript_12366/g.28116 Transcript_12366/m.28116 type:complete len:211 (-) Transcript_12366:541-1173(-)
MAVKHAPARAQFWQVCRTSHLVRRRCFLARVVSSSFGLGAAGGKSVPLAPSTSGTPTMPFPYAYRQHACVTDRSASTPKKAARIAVRPVATAVLQPPPSLLCLRIADSQTSFMSFHVYLLGMVNVQMRSNTRLVVVTTTSRHAALRARDSACPASGNLGQGGGSPFPSQFRSFSSAFLIHCSTSGKTCIAWVRKTTMARLLGANTLSSPL